MASAEDKRRLVERFSKAARHVLTREEELQQKQRHKQRQAQRQRAPRDRDDWRGDDEPETFAKIQRAAKARPPAPQAVPADLPRALVTAVHQSRVELDCGPARIAHRLLLDPRFQLVVGDEVACEPTDGPFRIVAVRPRRSWLLRPDPGNAQRELLLAANVDLGVITAAVQDPPLRPGLIDRLLLALQRGHVSPLLCINKVDLLDAAAQAQLDATLQPYVDQGVAVLCCSASSGRGLPELREALRGRTCVFVGHSGVGKSSLLNALDPDGARATGAVREHDGRGRHTTSASSLRLLADGTRVIDTSGIRAFGLAALQRDELAAAFPELAPLARQCRFGDCSHAHEPDCAVRAAVAAGSIGAARFAAYLRLLGEVEG